LKNAYQQRCFAYRSATALLATPLKAVKKKTPEPAQGMFICKRKEFFDDALLYCVPGISNTLTGDHTTDDISKDSKCEEVARIRALARCQGDFVDRRQV